METEAPCLQEQVSLSDCDKIMRASRAMILTYSIYYNTKKFSVQGNRITFLEPVSITINEVTFKIIQVQVFGTLEKFELIITTDNPDLFVVLAARKIIYETKKQKEEVKREALEIKDKDSQFNFLHRLLWRLTNNEVVLTTKSNPS